MCIRDSIKAEIQSELQDAFGLAGISYDETLPDHLQDMVSNFRDQWSTALGEEPAFVDADRQWENVFVTGDATGTPGSTQDDWRSQLASDDWRRRLVSDAPRAGLTPSEKWDYFVSSLPLHRRGYYQRPGTEEMLMTQHALMGGGGDVYSFLAGGEGIPAELIGFPYTTALPITTHRPSPAPAGSPGYQQASETLGRVGRRSDWLRPTTEQLTEQVKYLSDAATAWRIAHPELFPARLEEGTGGEVPGSPEHMDKVAFANQFLRTQADMRANDPVPPWSRGTPSERVLHAYLGPELSKSAPSMHGHIESAAQTMLDRVRRARMRLGHGSPGGADEALNLVTFFDDVFGPGGIRRASNVMTV